MLWLCVFLIIFGGLIGNLHWCGCSLWVWYDGVWLLVADVWGASVLVVVWVVVNYGLLGVSTYGF